MSEGISWKSAGMSFCVACAAAAVTCALLDGKLLTEGEVWKEIAKDAAKIASTILASLSVGIFAAAMSHDENQRTSFFVSCFAASAFCAIVWTVHTRGELPFKEAKTLRQIFEATYSIGNEASGNLIKAQLAVSYCFFILTNQ